MRRTLFGLSLFIVLAAPLFVFGATNECDGIKCLVPCDGVNCDFCHLIELGNNIIKWLISIFAVIIAIVIVIAGLRMVTAAGNPGQVSAAREMLTNAIIGFVILLAAWLIVDTVIKMFVDESKLGPWNEIQCVSPTVGPPPTSGGGPTTTPTAQCNDDAALMAQYGGSPVGLEAPGLRDLINCYLADPAVAAAVDNNQIYTVDRSYPRCALTNGNRVCGPCSHSQNSCHYGRGSGQGAKAVDFNARAGFTEWQLYQNIQVRRATCGGTVLNETDHTHISMSGC